MSRGNRWYIFASEGGEFDIVGFSFTKEAGRARVEQIDPGGSRSDVTTPPLAFQLFAKDRPEARKLAFEVFGVKARGYITPEDRRIGRVIVKSAVMRAIFCPFTQQVLDMRRAVVVVTPTKQAVMAATKWDEVKDRFFAGLRPEQRATVDVYDGRELFRRG